LVAKLTSSKKAKGRSLQKQVASDLREKTGLPEEDIQSKPMGSSGSDVIMSSAAIAKFPFSVECKNQESIQIWSAFGQAVYNSEREKRMPMLVFRRNRTDPLVLMRWSDFLKIYFK
jgi:hypothetical protein